MSDNKNIDIQNRGWRNMRSILDKEMPEKKKKRPVGYWFLFGSGVIATIIFLVMFVFPTQTKKSEIAENTKVNSSEKIINSDASSATNNINDVLDRNSTSNITDHQELSETDDLIEINEENRIQNNLEKKPENDVITAIVPSTRINNSTRNKNVSSKEKINEFADLDSASETLSEKKAPLKNLKVVENSIQITTLKTVDLPENEIESAEKKIIVPLEINTFKERSLLDPLIKLPFNIPFLQNVRKIDLFEDQLDIAIYNHNYNSFSPYLFATSNFQSAHHAFGYGIGAGLSYGNENLGMYLESSYLKSTYNNEKSDALALDFPESEIEDGDNGISIFSPSTNKIFKVSEFSRLTRKTDELKIDVGIRKKLFKKFDLDFGVAYTSLIRASNESFMIRTNSVVNNNPEGLTFDVNSRALFASGAYSKYDIVPHIGFEYGLTSNLFLNVHYNHGMINLIADTELQSLSSSSSNDELFRRNIGVKIRYKF